MVVNPQDTLYFESESMMMEGPHLYSTKTGDTLMDFESLKEEISLEVGRDVYREVPLKEAASMRGGVNKGIGLGFFMPS